MSQPSPPHIKFAVLLSCAVLSVQALQAAATTFTFSTSATGAQNWSNTANWTPATAPGTASDNAVINRTGASGDVTVTTPGTALVLGQFNFTAVSGSGLTLSLANNLTIGNNGSYGGSRGSINNATGDVTKMVFDLNGYTFDTVGTATYPLLMQLVPANSTFTVKSTGSAGGLAIFNDFSGKVSVQDNATVWIKGPNAVSFIVNTATSTFSSASTFQVSGGVGTPYYRTQIAVNGNATGDNAFGNFVIGDAANRATAINFTGTASSAVVVRGNFTMLQNSDLYLGYPSSLATIKVGGNYTDNGGGMFTTYSNSATANSTISMNGGISTERTLSINRTLNSAGGFSTSIQIGDGTNAGNVELVNASATVGAVYTAGGARVFANSRLDLGTSTTTGDVAPLRAGNIVIDSGATIGVTFGAHSGYALADATLGGSGNLTLNTF
ncbi:MAG: hypothetical protein ABI615_04910, partial [Chthoniobacterales bacterium]